MLGVGRERLESRGEGRLKCSRLLSKQLYYFCRFFEMRSAHEFPGAPVNNFIICVQFEGARFS
jgi:hypothetical protein